MNRNTKLYVIAFKELISEVIRENKNNPERAKKLIMEEILREAKNVFKPEDYEEIKKHAIITLMQIGVDISNIE